MYKIFFGNPNDYLYPLPKPILGFKSLGETALKVAPCCIYPIVCSIGSPFT